MPLPPGSRLGPYEIVSKLGEGGMGEVYRAVDSRLGRTVAIKILAPGHGERFHQEARAIAALNHPHICVLHDVGPDYLVMEHLDGQPVRGPLPFEDAIRIASQVADAMAAAHAKGILHRDLKPANILMTSSGAKLLDFGLAKRAGDDVNDATQTRVGTVLGTAAYMAPEQAQGRPADARSDIFSFGAVLYELLTGRRAFGGDTLLETLNAVVRDEPSAIESPAAGIVARCLDKEPGRRFQTMVDVHAALRSLQEGRRTQARADAPASIAVLPFANMSQDLADEYFSDGLAEEIINLLAQVQDLKVIARTSAFAFKGRNQDVRQIAQALGVTSILEGSVRRAGSRIRVTAQLIRADDGTHLWSQRYDREMADVFELQDDIASAIAASLKLKLAPRSERRMPSVPAYEAYLKHRSYLWQFTPEASERSRECLEQALALDPGFALPYVGLADYHLALGSVGGVPAHQAMPRARELATRALELEPDLPEAHAMLGTVAAHYDFDRPEADRRFALAVAREPLSDHLRHQHAMLYLLATGRHEAAGREMARVLADDPLRQMYHFSALTIHSAAGDFERALEAGQRSVEIDPGFWLGWLALGQLHAVLGRHADARSCAERAMSFAPWCPFVVGLMAASLANTGDESQAASLLAPLRDDAYLGPPALVNYCLGRGDAEGAVAWGRKAVEQRFPLVVTYSLRRYQTLLRETAGWSALLEPTGLV